MKPHPTQPLLHGLHDIIPSFCSYSFWPGGMAGSQSFFTSWFLSTILEIFTHCDNMRNSPTTQAGLKDPGQPAEELVILTGINPSGDC